MSCSNIDSKSLTRASSLEKCVAEQCFRSVEDIRFDTRFNVLSWLLHDASSEKVRARIESHGPVIGQKYVFWVIHIDTYVRNADDVLAALDVV